MIPMTRPQRVSLLVSKNAPLPLVENEIRVAIGEYMNDGLAEGRQGGFAWVIAAWGLFVRLHAATAEIKGLKKKLRTLQRAAKKQELPQ